jgi:hypothetical protein
VSLCLTEGCGAHWQSHSDSLRTLVGYSSPPGHDHDDNCLNRVYYCRAGHAHRLSLRRRCHTAGCDWVGKDSCSICDATYVDSWPLAVAG